MASNVRQHRFNTQFGLRSFDDALADQAREGFALVRIVPVDGYSAVAVFERPATTAGDSASSDSAVNPDQSGRNDPSDEA